MMRLAAILLFLLVFTPTRFAAQTMTLKVYFNNSKLDRKPDPCGGKVFPVSRTVPKTSTVAKTALEHLFAGPTVEEKAKGYESLFSAQTSSILKSVKIKNRTAYVNFTDMRATFGDATTSCGSSMFFAEVETTLKQFPNIKKVIYAIEGKPADFYEWMQMDCEGNKDCNEAPFRN